MYYSIRVTTGVRRGSKELERIWEEVERTESILKALRIMDKVVEKENGKPVRLVLEIELTEANRIDRNR